MYTGGSGDEFYCADVCIPSTCGDEEVCSLEDVQCDRDPCPPVAVCTDLCGGICDESQVRIAELMFFKNRVSPS